MASEFEGYTYNIEAEQVRDFGRMLWSGVQRHKLQELLKERGLPRQNLYGVPDGEVVNRLHDLEQQR